MRGKGTFGIVNNFHTSLALPDLTRCGEGQRQKKDRTGEKGIRPNSKEEGPSGMATTVCLAKLIMWAALGWIKTSGILGKGG